MARGEERLLLLDEVEALLASDALVVDACRHVVREDRTVVSLARRPVLFALARALGEAWPGDVPGTRSWPGHSGQGTPINRIAHGCGSRSGGCARCCGRWPA